MEENTSKTKLFIEKARKLHGDKYDYSKVEYITSKEKVCIICPEHGEFWQRADKHLMGQGCPQCATNHKGTLERFIERASKIHNNKYDYSKAVYINNSTKLCIICPEHGEFWQSPHDHLKHKGCPQCAKELTKPKKYTTEEFIAACKKSHQKQYDYSKTVFNGLSEKVTVICPEHGEFEQNAYIHLNGAGCPKCAHNENGFKKRKQQDVFLKQIEEIYQGKYDLSKVNYINAKIKVEIVCPKHGSFFVSPWHALNGCGCPKCVHPTSKAEDEIYNFVCSLIGKDNVVQSDRLTLNGKELDIFIPSLNTAIEYHGLYWHTDKVHPDRRYHLKKTELCQSKGIKLLQIFEDEYRDKKEIVLNKIKHILNISDNLPKIMGRKCMVKEISKEESNEFLDKFHIQGRVRATLYLGCFFNERLIGVMTFTQCDKEGKWELTRFASDYNYICQGIGGKLFNYFIRNYGYCEIKSFADRRWTVDETNNLYIQLGFEFDSYNAPDYRYIDRSKEPIRMHKFLFRKNRINKKYGFSLDMTENQMIEKLNLTKVYDCGLIKYVYKKDK